MEISAEDHLRPVILRLEVPKTPEIRQRLSLLSKCAIIHFSEGPMASASDVASVLKRIFLDSRRWGFNPRRYNWMRGEFLIEFPSRIKMLDYVTERVE